MTAAAPTSTMTSTTTSTLHDIVVDDLFPQPPETVWKTLTDGHLIGRWFLAPEGFAPVAGTRFTFRTTPAGPWDGVIRCEVLEVVENRRLAYAWKGGHPDNVGYGSPLDTVVTFLLSPAGAGTRVRLIHSGFALPRNGSAYRTMGEGWRKVLRNVEDVAARCG